MGDLNSRLKHSMTGDSLSTHNQYGELLYSFMMDTGMDYLRNEDLILKDRHWTFYAENAGNGGRSVVDYFLVPMEEKDIFKSYSTRDDLAIDSQHVIISCTMQVGIPLGDPWGDTNGRKINWDEETKTKFSKSLTQLLEDMDLIDTSLHSPHEITKYAMDLGKAITKAYETTSTENKKTRHKHSKGGIQDMVAGMPEYRRLITLRQNELKKLRTRPRKSTRERIWKKAKDYQKAIFTLISTTRIKLKKPRWKGMERACEDKDPKEFWKTLKQARRARATTFPAFMNSR